MSKEKLKKCDCGEIATIIHLGFGEIVIGGIYIRCERCGFRLPGFFNTEAEAIKTWNRRSHE